MHQAITNLNELTQISLTLDDKIIELEKQFSNLCECNIDQKTPLLKIKEHIQKLKTTITALKDNIKASNLTNKELTDNFSQLLTITQLTSDQEKENTIKRDIFKKKKLVEDKIVTQNLFSGYLDQYLETVEELESTIDARIQRNARIKAIEDRIVSFAKYILIIIIGCYAYKKISRSPYLISFIST